MGFTRGGREARHRQRTRHPFGATASAELSDEALARHAEAHRPAESRERAEVRQLSPGVCSSVLPKPMPGSRHIASGGIPDSPRARNRSSKYSVTSAPHRCSVGCDLHRPRCALHVHDNHTGLCIRLPPRIISGSRKPANVVDDRHARVEALSSDFRLHRVNRDGDLRTLSQLTRQRELPFAILRRVELVRRRAALIRRQCRGCPPLPRRVSGRGRRPFAGSKYFPPSEKLSGVTFTIPITSGRWANSITRLRSCHRIDFILLPYIPKNKAHPVAGRLRVLVTIRHFLGAGLSSSVLTAFTRLSEFGATADLNRRGHLGHRGRLETSRSSSRCRQTIWDWSPSR